MKELSIEEKAKAYDRALEIAKAWCKLDNNDLSNDDLKTIFPELKESEDERTQKDIIHFVQSRLAGFPECERFVAWLEKQGKQKPFDYENADIQQKDFAPKETVKEAESNLTPLERKVKDILFSFHINAADGISFDGTMAIVHNLITLCQQEQKPADRIEPKFKVGDWIVNNVSKDVFLIKSINNGYCTLEDIKGNIISPCLPPCESESHLWTIQDAKDGDVLCYETKNDFIIFIYKNGDINYHCCYNNGHLTTVDSFFAIQKHLLYYIHPATKEQRDLLFQKMHEVSYEWDKENKELKKIEQKSD